MGLLEWLRTGKRREDAPEDLWERQRRLESSQRALQLEWEETYDNIRRLLAKIAKREKSAALTDGHDAPEDDALTPTTGSPTASGDQFRLNQLLIRRRNGVLPR